MYVVLIISNSITVALGYYDIRAFSYITSFLAFNYLFGVSHWYDHRFNKRLLVAA